MLYYRTVVKWNFSNSFKILSRVYSYARVNLSHMLRSPHEYQFQFIVIFKIKSHTYYTWVLINTKL